MQKSFRKKRQGTTRKDNEEPSDMVVLIAQTIHVDEEVKRLAQQCGLPLPEHLQEETE